MGNTTIEKNANDEAAMAGLEWEEATPFEDDGSDVSENPTMDGEDNDEVQEAQALAQAAFEEVDAFEESTNVGEDDPRLAQYVEEFGDKTAPEASIPPAALRTTPPQASAREAEDGEVLVPAAPPASAGSAVAEAAKSRGSSAASPAAEEEEEEEAPRDLEPKALNAHTPLVVLFEHAQEKHTGILTFRNKTTVVELRLIDGVICEVKTEEPELSLSTFLVNKGLCTKEQMQSAQMSKAQFGDDLGAALISNGIIPPHLFLENVGEWSRSVIEHILNWNIGQARMSLRRLKSPAIPLGFKRFKILSESVRRGIDRKTIDRKLPDRATVPVLAHREDGLTPEDLMLEPKELRILRGITGAISIEAMMQEGPHKADPLPLLRLIYLAAQLELITFLDNPKFEEYEKRAKELDALADDLAESNYFDVLDVNMLSSDEIVTKSYHQKIKKHHPDALPNDIPAELAAAHMRLYGIYQNAYNALATEDRRERYQMVVAEGYRDEESAVKGIIKGRLAIKKAKVMARLNKYADAVKFIDGALELKPDDYFLIIYKGYFTFMLTGGRDPNIAEQLVLQIAKLIPERIEKPDDPKKKQELNDKLVDAYTYMGRLYKLIGEIDGARRIYQKVLDIDPRNNEAETEVKHAKMRKDAQGKRGGGEKSLDDQLADAAEQEEDGSSGDGPAPRPRRGSSLAPRAGSRANSKAGGKAGKRNNSVPPRANSAIGSFLKKLKKED